MALFQIHRAQLADGARLWALVDRYQREARVLVPDTAAEVFRPDRGDRAWIAVSGCADIGCAFLRRLEGSAAALELKRFYVVPAWRGRGVAWALLEALIGQARTAGATAIYLDTADDMVAAQGLYHRAGFAACAPYNENPQAASFMRLALRDPPP